MALLVHTWDLPLDREELHWYERRGGELVPTILAQPGVLDCRAYRSPTGASPQVMVEIELETMAALSALLSSDEYRQVLIDLQSCRNISVAVWDASPLLLPHR
jgi:hypothetical protein